MSVQNVHGRLIHDYHLWELLINTTFVLFALLLLVLLLVLFPPLFLGLLRIAKFLNINHFTHWNFLHGYVIPLIFAFQLGTVNFSGGITWHIYIICTIIILAESSICFHFAAVFFRDIILDVKLFDGACALLHCLFCDLTIIRRLLLNCLNCNLIFTRRTLLGCQNTEQALDIKTFDGLFELPSYLVFDLAIIIRGTLLRCQSCDLIIISICTLLERRSCCDLVAIIRSTLLG
mmetsp:Transcript_26502/g.56920  ORF Transcript_26502/g.56920 Transcript_26502/m.56920 type:complete len:233 (-) Transcript_26502:639-1337(-)